MTAYWGHDPECVSAWCGLCGTQIAEGATFVEAHDAEIEHMEREHAGFPVVVYLDDFVNLR